MTFMGNVQNMKPVKIVHFFCDNHRNMQNIKICSKLLTFDLTIVGNVHNMKPVQNSSRLMWISWEICKIWNQCKIAHFWCDYRGKCAKYETCAKLLIFDVTIIWNVQNMNPVQNCSLLMWLSWEMCNMWNLCKIAYFRCDYDGKCAKYETCAKIAHFWCDYHGKCAKYETCAKIARFWCDYHGKCAKYITCAEIAHFLCDFHGKCAKYETCTKLLFSDVTIKGNVQNMKLHRFHILYISHGYTPSNKVHAIFLYILVYFFSCMTSILWLKIWLLTMVQLLRLSVWG